MGQQKVDGKPKTMSPLQVAYNLTPLLATAGRSAGSLGVVPIGSYRGGVAFWDLDLAVRQPLVWAEQQHILGILDGREEDYDLQTLAIVAAEAALTPHTGTLTVPAGLVYYLNAVEMVLPGSGGANIITGNWRCSLWTDRAATPSPAGQAFHAVDVAFGVGGGTQWDEFGVIPLLWAPTNKPVALRLPAGTVLTFTAINTVAPAAANVNAIFRVYGYIGKALVA